MATVFISHASTDRAFALRLARSLEQLGHFAWVDAEQLQIGELIPQAVAKAVDQADYLIVVLSIHSGASSWSEHEWNAKYWEEIATRRTLVLPVLLEDCTIPLFLRPKRHADFRSDYALGLAQIAVMLRDYREPRTTNSGSNHLTQNEAQIATSHRLEALISSEVSVCYTNETMKYLGRLEEIQVELEVPYLGRVAGIWKPDEREQDAAWEMYVELVTRISVAELPPSDGLLREGLTSLYSMFTTTRQILKSYGPVVARPKSGGQLSFGYLAISILNYVLRPVLAKWHPLLMDYEHRRPESVSVFAHEAAWEHARELREALSGAQTTLLDYTNLLAQISHIPHATPSLPHHEALHEG